MDRPQIRLGRCGFAVMCLAVVLSPTVAFAIDITIDDFQTADPVWPVIRTTAGTTTRTEIGLPGASVIGGERITNIVGQSFAVPGVDQVIGTIAPGPGIFDYVSSSGANGAVNFVYLGPGGGGLNANLAGTSGIRLDFLEFDHANSLDMSVSVTLFDGNTSTALADALTTSGGQSLYFNFNDFPGINAFDLSNVQSLDILVDPQLAADFRLAGISTFNELVPEPTAVAVWGVVACVAGLAFRRQRRRMTA